MILMLLILKEKNELFSKEGMSEKSNIIHQTVWIVEKNSDPFKFNKRYFKKYV